MIFERLLTLFSGPCEPEEIPREKTSPREVVACTLEGRSIDERLLMAGVSQKDRDVFARFAERLFEHPLAAARRESLLPQAVFALEKRMRSGFFAGLAIEYRLALVVLSLQADFSLQEACCLTAAVGRLLTHPKARAVWRTGVSFLSGSARSYGPLPDALPRARLAQELLEHCPRSGSAALTLHLALLASPVCVLVRALRVTPEALYIVEPAVRGLAGKQGTLLLNATVRAERPLFAPVWLTDPLSASCDAHTLPNVRALRAPNAWARAFLDSLSSADRTSLPAFETLFHIPLEGSSPTLTLWVLGRAFCLTHPVSALTRLLREAFDRIADETARNPALERFFFFDDPDPVVDASLAECLFTGIFLPLEYVDLSPVLWLDTLAAQGAVVDPAPLTRKGLSEALGSLAVAPAEESGPHRQFPAGLPVGEAPHPLAVLRYCAVTERPVWGVVLVVQKPGPRPSPSADDELRRKLRCLSLARAFEYNTHTSAQLACRREFALQKERALRLPTLTRGLTDEALEVLDPILTVREREQLSRASFGEILLESLLAARRGEEHATDASTQALLRAFSRDARRPIVCKPRGQRRTPPQKKAKPKEKQHDA